VEFVDYKGTKSGDGSITSRVLKVHLKDGRCWIEIHSGPGEMINGAVKPKGKATTEISIPLTLFEARRLAHACLAYILAWDVSERLRLVLPGSSDREQDGQ
jgi:hypothetical protein